MSEKKELKVLSLKQMEDEYGFSPGTIKRERWEQKRVKEHKLKPNEKVSTGGFGFETPAIMQYGKLKYKRTDIEAWLDKHLETAPTQSLKDNGIDA
tara:strand:+ start:743 stop:1030 length:288 start_codon:yes stop_codon:yes gene_type:complete